LVVGSLVVAVTSVEVGLRLAGLPTSHRHFALSDTYRLDPDLVYTVRPGARGTWRTAEFVETPARRRHSADRLGARYNGGRTKT
jgi:hypothetical protein